MKFLFRVTWDYIDTLLIGVHFISDGKTITLIDENKTIFHQDLDHMLLNTKIDYVIFTENLDKLSYYQLQIYTKLKGIEGSDWYVKQGY